MHFLPFLACLSNYLKLLIWDPIIATLARIFSIASKSILSEIIYLLPKYCQLSEINFFVCVVLGFELRVSALIGKHSIAWDTPPAFLLWLFWRLGLTFCPGWPGPQSFYFRFCCIAGMTGVFHHIQIFPLRWGLSNFYVWAGLELWSCNSQPPN
jgi:hypothetical protein